MMDFTNLIEKYSESIIVIVPGERYRDWEDGGTWKEGPPQEVKKNAAVFQIGTKGLSTQLQYGEGGTYSISDIKVYIQEELTTGQRVKWKDKEYTINDILDYSSHSKDLYVYVCKGVS